MKMVSDLDILTCENESEKIFIPMVPFFSILLVQRKWKFF